MLDISLSLYFASSLIKHEKSKKTRQIQQSIVALRNEHLTQLKMR